MALLEEPSVGRQPAGPATDRSPSRAPRTAHRGRVAALQRALLAWWDAHRRALPWRRDRDPYRVWVAEVMLQQTRVEVAASAYDRFLAAFPDLATLANADQERVLALWSGLGYYGRARALHRASRALVAAGERTFPHTREAALRLPGVGPYTAAAVLSIARGAQLAAVDGNVVRVLARLERLGLPDTTGEPHAALAARLLDRERPGDWNQALMELGQTVCRAHAPLCGACPVAQWCRAQREGAVAHHPPRRRRTVAERHVLSLVVMRDRAGRVLLERGAFPHLRHLWLPPTGRAALGRRPCHARYAGSFRHSILHRTFDVRVLDCVVPGAVLDRAAGAPASGRTRPRAVQGAHEAHAKAPASSAATPRTTAPPHARGGAASVERRAFARDELAAIGRSSLLTKALRLVDAERTEVRAAISAGRAG